MSSKQPSYKLLYLNVRSYGEPIRLLLHHKDIEFEDVRFDRNTFYVTPELKKLTPYGKVPVLQIEGNRPLAQSGAILRHLARKFDLNGKSEEEVARADEIYGFVADCVQKISPFLVVQGDLEPGDKKKLLEELLIPTAKHFLPIYNQILTESTSDFLLSSGLTYIDFVVVDQLYTVEHAQSSLLDAYPELKKLKDRVYSLKGVKEYVETRPKTLV